MGIPARSITAINNEPISLGSSLSTFGRWLGRSGQHLGGIEDIVPGLRFRQSDDSIWEVERMVHFQRYPIPHVELVKVHPVKFEGTTARKIISQYALLDRSLYRLESTEGRPAQA